MPTQKRPFEIIDGLFKQDQMMTKQIVQIEHKLKIDSLNKDIGKYHSKLEKRPWSLEDPMLFELAIKRLQEIEEKVMKNYQEMTKQE